MNDQSKGRQADVHVARNKNNRNWESQQKRKYLKRYEIDKFTTETKISYEWIQVISVKNNAK